LKRISINISLKKSVILKSLANIVVAALGLSVCVVAAAQQFRPYAEPQITPAQWDDYYNQVATKFSKTLRELEADNLQMFFNETTFVTYTFTKVGHPAHPAWITRLVVATTDKVTISQLGFYAGSEQEYKKLFDSFNDLNERLKASIVPKPSEAKQ
jgi:hypothetical protein